MRQRRSPAEGEFLDEQPLEECLTALGGVPLLVVPCAAWTCPVTSKPAFLKPPPCMWQGRGKRLSEEPDELEAQPVAAGTRQRDTGRGEALRGLAEVNQELVRELGRRSGQKIATIDLDATIIASRKRQAPIKAAAAISLCWRCGRSSTWRLPTSFATATCRRCKIR